MHSEDWQRLLSASIGRTSARLRDPICADRLREIRRHVGVEELPHDYESFLRCTDGGWIGDRFVYGSTEILALPASSEPTPRLLPFHSVDRFGVECLELETGAVLWCRSGVRFDLGAIVHGAALRVFAGLPVDTCERTYCDFTDWALDALTDEAFERQRVAGIARLN